MRRGIPHREGLGRRGQCRESFPLTHPPTHPPTHRPYSPTRISAYSSTRLGQVYVDVTAPARRALAAAACAAEVFDAAAAAGTHVAGGAEGAEEAERGAQPGGVLARNAFRAGHSGQVVRCIDEASERWWSRAASEWRDDEALLAAGALVVSNARREVTRQLGFTCSAGVAPNKLLAKLCGGLHKPDQQTLLAPRAVSALLDPLPVDRLRGFGGKLGDLNPSRSHSPPNPDPDPDPNPNLDPDPGPKPNPNPEPNQASWARHCGSVGPSSA